MTDLRRVFDGSSFAGACSVLLVLVLASQMLHGIHATEFQVNNTALSTTGGQRFNTELGDAAMQQVLEEAANYILEAFSLSPQKDVPVLTLLVEDMDGVAYTAGSEIHLSAQYVEAFQGDLVYEITGVLYHESTHVWQNNNGNYGSDSNFTGTIEGMADTIRLEAGFPAKSWVQEKSGDWYAGYSNTAYFFNWIETTQNSGFVNQLNQLMASPWTDDFFRQIVGKDVDTLWQEYIVS